jgi:membrane-bound ClpP family serine protease
MTLPILLLIVGLLLIVAELMFPTLGMLGVAAAACIIAAIAVAFARDSDMGMQFMIATAVCVPAVILLGFKLLPRSPAARLLINTGFSFKDGAAVDRRDRNLLGVEGTTDSLLRPSGTMQLDGRRVDVITRGEAIEAGTRVRVIEIEGNRVVVARVEADPPA